MAQILSSRDNIGALSLTVGTIINLIQKLFPNSIHTTILDHNFDSRHNYYKHRPQQRRKSAALENPVRPMKPPFYGAESKPNSESAPATESPRQTNSDSESSDSDRRAARRRRRGDDNDEPQRRGEQASTGNLKTTLERPAKSDPESNRLQELSAEELEGKFDLATLKPREDQSQSTVNSSHL